MGFGRVGAGSYIEVKKSDRVFLVKVTTISIIVQLIWVSALRIMQASLENIRSQIHTGIHTHWIHK